MVDFSVPDIKAASIRTVELAKNVFIKIDVGDFASALTDNLGHNVDRLLGKGVGDISFKDVKLIKDAVNQTLTPLIVAAGHSAPKVILAGLTLVVLISLIKYVFSEFKDFDLKKKQLDSNGSLESPPANGED